MAMIEVFCIFDNKAKAFAQPFFLPNQAVAIRAFREVANDPTSQICKAPSDFELFSVGQFDDELGKLLPANQLVSLGLATLFKD